MKRPSPLAIGFGSLVVLITALPVFALSSGWLGPQVCMLFVCPILLSSRNATDADLERVLTIVRPLLIFTLFPLAWMLIQLLPLPLGSISHSIWQSAANALQGSLLGHTSIDLGFTFRAILSFVGLICLLVSAAVLTRDRDRAETILMTMCIISAFAALELILFRDSDFLKRQTSNGLTMSSFVALASIGSILSSAFVVKATERYAVRSSRIEHGPNHHLALTAAGTAGCIVCLSGLALSGTVNNMVATGFGLVTLCLAAMARRLRLSRTTTVVTTVALTVVCVGIAIIRYSQNVAGHPIFRFTDVSAAESAATLSMISDTGASGVGVGTYQALTAIYRDASGYPGAIPPNTLSSIIAEWGAIGLLILLCLFAFLLGTLVRGALSRRRDACYAAGAAGTLVTILLEAFCDASLTQTAVQILASIVIGLGLSQSAGSKA